MRQRVVQTAASGRPGGETNAAGAGAAKTGLVRFYAPGLPCSLALDVRDLNSREAAPQRAFWIPALRA